MHKFPRHARRALAEVGFISSPYDAVRAVFRGSMTCRPIDNREAPHFIASERSKADFSTKASFTTIKHCPHSQRGLAEPWLMDMQTVADGGRPRGGPECDLPIEKGLLLLGSIEFQIDNHLMSHGTRIDPETRFFMAQVRDAAGDAATKMLDEARNRSETAPAGSPGGVDANAPSEEVAEFQLLQPGVDSVETRDPDVERSRAFARGAARSGLGTAAVILFTALLVTGWMATGTGMESARKGRSGAGEPAVSITASSQFPLPMIQPRRPAVVSSSQVAGPVRDEVPPRHPGQGADFGEAEQPAVPSYRQLAEALAFKLHPRKRGEQPPYPDPRAGPEQTAPMGEQASAMAEQRLDLSAGARREVQHRLALARFDPQHFDGIFGPATRAALREWQGAGGIPATGYLNASALVLLREQTADGYRAKLAANKARARQQARRAVLTSPVPQVSPRSADGCSRTPTGEIVYGKGVRCDFRGLRQSIAGLFG